MKSTKISDASVVQAVDASLTKLSSERELWETGDYARSNATLYRLLAECLGLYLDSFKNCSETAQQEIRKNVETKLKALGLKVQHNSQTINLFVKVVFGSERKRADKYASVLRIAVAEQQSKATFVGWLSAYGGIEEVRRHAKSTPPQAISDAIEKRTESVKQGIAAARHNALGTVTLNAQVHFSNTNLLIAETDPNGKLNVVGVLSNIPEALLNRVHKEMGKQSFGAAEPHTLLSIPPDAIATTSIVQEIRPNSVVFSPPRAAARLSRKAIKQRRKVLANIAKLVNVGSQRLAPGSSN